MEEKAEAGSKRKAGLKIFIVGIVLFLVGGLMLIVPRHSELINLIGNLLGFALVAAGASYGLAGLLQILTGYNVWAFVTKKR